jgi:hypothetical protein
MHADLQAGHCEEKDIYPMIDEEPNLLAPNLNNCTAVSVWDEDIGQLAEGLSSPTELVID